jgi:hypothetical protein
MDCWLVSVVVLVSLLAPGYVHAQESTARPLEHETFRLDDYCERVRETAKSNAAVLLGPRMGAQAIRFPAAGDLVLGQAVASYTQVRAYAQYVLTDAYRGSLTLRLGDAECRRERLAQPLEDAIRVATDQGRREALGQKLRFLREHDDAVTTEERDAEARRRAEVSTVVELMEVYTLASAFRAQEVETEDELSRLDAQALPEPTQPLYRQAIEYEQASMDLERIASGIRRASPWGLSLTGGVAASQFFAADWFGSVDLSYNFGGLVQSGAEDRLLAARARELESARYELAHRARAVDAALGRSVEELKRRISLVEGEAGELRAQESVFEASQAPASPHLVSVVRLRLFVVEAQLIYLRTLAERRRPWESSR